MEKQVVDMKCCDQSLKHSSYGALPCRIHPNALEYVSFGKPNPFVFKNAEAILRQLRPSYHDDHLMNNGDSGSEPFKTIYMIGDNPFVDIKGAQQVCLLTLFEVCRTFFVLQFQYISSSITETLVHFESTESPNIFGVSGRTSLVFYFDEDRRV